MKDDRFAANLATIHARSGMDITIASMVIGAYCGGLNALPRKARRAPYDGSSAVTTGCSGDGSGSVTADYAGHGSERVA